MSSTSSIDRRAEQELEQRRLRRTRRSSTRRWLSRVDRRLRTALRGTRGASTAAGRARSASRAACGGARGPASSVASLSETSPTFASSVRMRVVTPSISLRSACLLLLVRGQLALERVICASTGCFFVMSSPSAGRGDGKTTSASASAAYERRRAEPLVLRNARIVASSAADTARDRRGVGGVPSSAAGRLGTGRLARARLLRPDRRIRLAPCRSFPDGLAPHRRRARAARRGRRRSGPTSAR